jgi:hypothetical protein
MRFSLAESYQYFRRTHCFHLQELIRKKKRKKKRLISVIEESRERILNARYKYANTLISDQGKDSNDRV